MLRLLTWLRVLGWMLITFSVLFWVFDFSTFVRSAFRNYKKAIQWDYTGSTGGEGIVVLTGDRGRIAKAFELLRKRNSDWLIISGAGRGITLTELVNQQGDSATSIHTTWERIVLESKSASTIENALESAGIIRSKKPNRIFLVTSDYHMLRAAQIFRDVLPGQEIIEYPVPSGLMGPWLLNSSFPRFFWIVGLEYWKYRLYLTRRGAKGKAILVDQSGIRITNTLPALEKGVDCACDPVLVVQRLT